VSPFPGVKMGISEHANYGLTTIHIV